MTLKEYEALGYRQTRERMEVIRAACPNAAASYAEGAATALRDILCALAGQNRASYWFQCLGQDAITEPRNAARKTSSRG